MTTARGKVVCTNDGGTSVDLAPTADMVRGREIYDLAFIIVRRKPSDASDFAERIIVKE